MKKNIFILGIVWLFTNTLFSQNIKINKVEELKTYSLSHCLQNNYKKIDSTFQSKDVTNSFIAGDLVALSPKQLSNLNLFIENKTSFFYKPIPNQEYDVSNANMIFYKCLEFYKSNELKKYIRKLLKEKDLE